MVDTEQGIMASDYKVKIEITVFSQEADVIERVLFLSPYEDTLEELGQVITRLEYALSLCDKRNQEISAS